MKQQELNNYNSINDPYYWEDILLLQIIKESCVDSSEPINSLIRDMDLQELYDKYYV